jgi:beta-glucosidase
VLLKNDKAVLPLRSNSKIAVIGFASDNGAQLSYGHGSGEVAPSKYVSPLVGITEAAGSKAQITFSKGNDLEEARALARGSDYAVIFVGASASEGGDRAGLSLNGACKVSSFMRTMNCDGPDDYQDELVRAVSLVNKHTIVVLSVPGAILMPWSPLVSGVVVNFMPGQEAGHSIADVLFGRVNPSAKLPITMPNRENEVNFHNNEYPGIKSGSYNGQDIYQLNYTEQLHVGYRYYDRESISFRTGFPFGHGLSYTSFGYSGLNINGRDVSFTVRNSGRVPGAEVAQLYLEFPAEAGEPRQLKGFKLTKVLAPGESETVTLTLQPRDTAIWDVQKHDWSQVSGQFGVNIGASSRDFKLRGSLSL